MCRLVVLHPPDQWPGRPKKGQRRGEKECDGQYKNTGRSCPWRRNNRSMRNEWPITTEWRQRGKQRLKNLFTFRPFSLPAATVHPKRQRSPFKQRQPFRSPAAAVHPKRKQSLFKQRHPFSPAAAVHPKRRSSQFKWKQPFSLPPAAARPIQQAVHRAAASHGKMQGWPKTSDWL